MRPVQWIRADWAAPSNVVAGTTLRQGGVSSGPYASLNLGAHVGDEAFAVSTNRERFRSACGLPAEPRWLNQVHGKMVVSAEASGPGAEADGIVTTRPGTVCAVLTADCLPVLFTSADGKELGAAHAGWRGLRDGILEQTVAAFSARPKEILAWLGPAISQQAFEVGTKVREQFVARHADAAAFFSENERGRWHADLYGLATLRLGQAGIRNISGGGRCTFGEADAFFSYRRDGQCGRMATFVFRRQGSPAGRAPTEP